MNADELFKQARNKLDDAKAELAEAVQGCELGDAYEMERTKARAACNRAIKALIECDLYVKLANDARRK